MLFRSELKESLTAELQNLQQEKIENEKNLRQVNLRISTTERELDNAVSQNNFIEKMLNNGLTESSDVSAILKIESKEDQKLNAENKFINNDSLNQVKNVKVVLNAEIRTSFSDSIDKISISESSIDEKEQKLKLLSEYSGLLDQQLKENKTKLKGKLNKNDKQEIQNEIKLIEKEIVMRKTEREDLSNLINKEKITDSKQNLNGNLDSVIVMNDSVQAEKLSNNEIKSANDSFLIKQEILVAQLTAIDTSDLKSSVLNAKMSSLKTYNALIDNKINLNKAEIKKEANKDERKRLEAENKELTSLKNKNSLAINEASKRK